MKRRFVPYFLFIMLISCRGNTSAPVTETPILPTATLLTTPLVPTETAVPTSKPVPRPTVTPEPRQLLTIPQYQITAELDYGWKVVTAQQRVTIPNPSNQPLSEIVLVVQPNWYPGTFQLDELSWGDGALITEYTLEGIRLKIPLAEPWQPNTAKNLSLSFTLSLPPLDRGEEFGPNPFGYTNRQVNLTDWHPFVPPFVAGQWLVHNPWFYGEHLVYPIADYEAEIQVSNAPEGTLIAANALDQGSEGVHLYEIKDARNFVWSVSHEYRVFEAKVDGVTILGYGFPYDTEIGEAAFESTVESFRLYQELFGPYPHNSLTMIQADFLHGMEYDGLYYLSKAFYNTYDGTPATYLVAIAVHETAHQWWFGLVGNDQAIQPWLDEAICTFAELLYYENLHPEALQWWWDYRVDYYQPQGWVDLSIYEFEGYRPYRDAVYLNGMKFLLELRELVGDDIFAAFLQDYLAQSSHQIATTDDFFSILSEHTDTNLRPLKAKYFQNP